MRTALLVCVASIACSGATAPEPCAEAIAVVVSTVTPPRIHWSPACGISQLMVTTVASSPTEERTVWGFSVDERSPVGPGIRYGVAPRDAEVWTGAEALEVGRTYRVTVMFTIGGDAVAASGSTTFVWFPPD